MAEDRIYLESEIIEDDPNAPVGKLVQNSAPTGPVEEEVVGNVVYQFVPTQSQRSRTVANKRTTSQDKDPWASNRVAATTSKKEDEAVSDTVSDQLNETKFENESATSKAAAARKSERAKAYAASKDPWSNANVKNVKKTASNKPAVKTDAAKSDLANTNAAKPTPAKADTANKSTSAAKTSKAATTAAAADVAAKKPRAAKATNNEQVKTKSEENINMAKDVKDVKADEKTTAKKATAAKADVSQEKVIIEGDSSIPHGKFVIKKTDNGNFVYKLFSSNRRVLATPGGAYKDLSSCKNGIQSVMTNAGTAPIEDQTLKNVVEQKCPKWVIYVDNKNEVRLRLLASNGNVVAITNDGYLSKDAAKKGIDAIARAAKGADVVRNDDLW